MSADPCPPSLARSSAPRLSLVHPLAALCGGLLSLGLLSLGLLAGCSSERADSAASVETSAPRFVDIAAEVGLDHIHHKPILDDKLSNIMSWMASVGATVASADYDADGDIDLFFSSSRKGEPNRLYRNDDGVFTEVGEAAGLAAANDERGTSMDAVFGDYDNDGDADLYLVRWGYDSLYRNNGDGTFEDVTAEHFVRRDGSPGTDWANGNAVLFFDFDLDGRLDIYVGNYFQEVDLWNLENTLVMHDDFEVARNGGENFLYHQQEDGTFVEKAAEHGVNDPGWTLAVGTGDLDGNGWPDLYSADDFGPDQLFLGQPGGTMINATESAIGFDTKKGMNADFGDFNNDGWLDIYVTNITTAEYLQEGNMLWYNQGLGEDGLPTFTDISLEAGTYDGGWGWGAKFFDYENDGDLDIIAANGFISAGEGSYWYDLASWTVLGQNAADASLWPPIGDRSFSGYEKERLWRNDGLFAFTEVATAEGLATDRDGRGIAIVDFDNDGDLDVVIANQDQAPHLFRNNTNDELVPGAGGPHWLTVMLETDPETGVNRDGIGTRVTLRAGDSLFVREREGGNGYSGQSDPRLQFGLGTLDAPVVELLEVRWPDGGLQYFENVEVDRFLTVKQDPAAYVDGDRLLLEAPTLRPEVEGQLAELTPSVDPAEVAARLDDMESRLAFGYDRALASEYRIYASGHDEHDRSIGFLEQKVEAENSSDWRIELSLAYVDKIPACGGVAAIVCKGTLARKGLDQLDHVLEQEPESWLALYSRGMNHLHWPRALRHSAEAAEDLEAALALHGGDSIRPFDVKAWVALGQAYAKDGRYEEARDAWRRGLALFPEATDLSEHLAITDDDALLERIEELRSLQSPLDTDLSFYGTGA